MATTPRAYEWEFYEEVQQGASTTGALLHYFDKEGQLLYLDDGIQSQTKVVDDGHWHEGSWGHDLDLETDPYSLLYFDHPANTTAYGVALYGNNLYLLRYDYCKDVSNMIENCTWRMQIDNPIAQVTLALKNTSQQMFTRDATIFMPGAKILVGLAFGDSNVYDIGIAYIDDIDYNYLSRTVAISGRNSIGYILSDQTMDETRSMSGQLTDTWLEYIFERMGIEHYDVDNSFFDAETTFGWNASDTALSVIQKIIDAYNNTEKGLDQIIEIEELPSGEIICGHGSWTKRLQRGIFLVEDNMIITRKIAKNIDGAYSKLYLTGKNTSGNERAPIIRTIDNFPFWAPGEHRTLHMTADGMDASTAELYADTLCRELKYTGETANYRMKIQPTLVIGDMLKQFIPQETYYKSLGIITEITHTLGERGFFTDVTCDSGGDATEVENVVYTTARKNNGNNRKKRISDFIN